jgi:5'-phosphate synthase pdxT subunit
MAGPLVGVLALQGASQEHLRALAALDVDARPVRVPGDLDGVDAMVLPGGESTTMSMLLESSETFDPIAERLAAGMPVFGTCAGMILLATEVLDGRSDQRSFGAVDLTVRRNAFGRQVASFETDLAVNGLDAPFRAVFIRAPGVERVGDDVEVRDVPALCRAGSVLVAAFHPELTPDLRLHRLFLESVCLRA